LTARLTASGNFAACAVARLIVASEGSPHLMVAATPIAECGQRRY
jgi:hypothetical protein